MIRAWASLGGEKHFAYYRGIRIDHFQFRILGKHMHILGYRFSYENKGIPKYSMLNKMEFSISPDSLRTRLEDKQVLLYLASLFRLGDLVLPAWLKMGFHHNCSHSWSR